MSTSESTSKQIADIIESGVPSEIEEINRKYALTMWGSKAVVIVEDSDQIIQIRSVDAFNSWFANRRIQVPDGTGAVRSISLGKAWLSHPNRRQYEGVEFFPNPDAAPAKTNYLNLWRGFSVSPSELGSYRILEDHIFNNIWPKAG